MKRKLGLFILMFFSLALVFAEPGHEPGHDPHKKGHKNFHGKRMMEEDDEFHLLFVKSKHFPEVYNFGFVFSQPIDPDSLENATITLYGNTLEIKNIRFSKNYRTVDFLVDADTVLWTEENSKLIISDIESIGGKPMIPVVIEKFRLETDYRLFPTGLR